MKEIKFHMVDGGFVTVAIEKETVEETMEFLAQLPWHGFCHDDGSGLVINMKNVTYVEVKEV